MLLASYVLRQTWPMAARGLCLVLTLVLVALVGCTDDPVSNRPSVTAESVAESGPANARQRTIPGVAMSWPGGTFADDGAITMEAVRIPEDAVRVGDLPEGVLVPVGEGVSVKSSEQPAKPVQFVFTVPEELRGSSDPLVVVWRGAEGWSWLPTTVSADRGSASAQSMHFSVGFLARLDVDRWARDAARKIVAVMTGRADVKAPECRGQQQLEGLGVSVTVTNSDTVRVCAGVEKGVTVVKIANNRRTWTQVDYPKAWKVVAGQSYNVSFAALARALHDPTPSKMATRVVDGGDTLTLEIPKDAEGTAVAFQSTTSWFVSAIVFGFDVLAGVKKAAGGSFTTAGMTKRSQVVDMLNRFGGDTGWNAALEECVRSTSDHVNLGAKTQDLEFTQGVFKAVMGCLPGLAKADLAEVGSDMFGAGILISGIASVVGLVATAINLIVTGTRSAWDDLASLGGESNSRVEISLKRGQWGMLQALPHDLASAQQVAQLIKGVRPLNDQAGDDNCTWVSVLGADLPAGSIDLILGTSASCGGDGAGTAFRVRNKKVASSGSACYECETSTADYEAIVKPYRRNETGLALTWEGAGWGLEPDDHVVPGDRICEDVIFEQNSGDGAWEVDVHDMSCARARMLIRTVARIHNFTNGPREFPLNEFWCQVGIEQSAIPMGYYSCSAKTRRVSWVKS